MNKLLKSLLLPALAATMLIPSCSQKNSGWSVKSPSGNIEFRLIQADSGKLFYTVNLVDSGKTINVVDHSPLGIVTSKGVFMDHLEFIEIKPVFTIDETFDLPAGKQIKIENRANEITVSFENASGLQIDIIARAYDDGIAFRYAIPGEESEQYTIESEITGFKIAGEGKAWIQPYDRVTMWTPAYETFYTNSIPIGTPSDSAEGWAFPALFHTDRAWVLLTESSVDSSCYGSHLQPEAEEGLYTIRLPEAEEAMNTMNQKPVVAGTWKSPWRVIITGKNVSVLVESNMVTKLAPESLIGFDWVKPGRASWSWWSEPASPRDYNALKRYVDLAAEMGWEYSLVDANWDLMKGGNIEQLVSYANSKNIGILLWYNSGGPHNTVTERPRDIMNDPAKRKDEFRKIAGWGVKGVKVDFFQSDKPGMMKLYLDILKDAAENKIMVNFHGCTLPRGWNRTWPNLVSMEAVRGAENYQFDPSYPEKAVWHNTILPFTRNVVGSMDYTPVTFTDQTYPHLTTDGHELALSVVFESGILHFADRAEAYRTLPEQLKEFLKSLPVSWDETILLDGEPGRFCIMARRSGKGWYLAGINGTRETMEWNIDLSRLENRGTKAEIMADGVDKTQFSFQSTEIKLDEKMNVKVLPAGGFVAVFK